jgi:hypothetical protein
MRHTFLVFLLLSTIAQAQTFNLNPILKLNHGVKSGGLKSQAQYFNFNNED